MIDKVQKIRKEVEKLMYGFNLEADIASCENAEAEKLANIKYQLCKKILEYIDSLQEEPVSEKKCIFTKDNYTDEDRKTLCEDCKEKCEYSKKEEPVSEELKEAVDEYAPDFSNSIASKAAVDAVRDAFKAGSEWKEEQMMAKAIDAHVNYAWSGLSFGGFDWSKTGLDLGDKCKLIIIKED